MTHSAGDKFNVLIKALPTSSALLNGVLAAPLRPIQTALSGMPQTARMGRQATLQFQFLVQSTAPVHVLATAYSTELPDLALYYYPTPSSLPVVPPDAYFNSDNDAAEGFLSFTPTTGDIGKRFLIELKSSNMSYVSLALRLAAGEGEDSDAAITGTPAVDPPAVGAPTHTVVLLNGQPQRDQVGMAAEHLYVFYVPAGVSGAISISLDPIQVSYSV